VSGSGLYIAPAVFDYKSLDRAREQGLTTQWLRAIAGHEGRYQRALSVRQAAGIGSPFRVGDIVLQVDGELPLDLQHLGTLFQKPAVDVLVFRDGEERQLQVETLRTSAAGVERALNWAGSLVHDPHFEIGFQRANDTRGVFISASDTGSPSIQDRLYRNRFIVAVEGVPVQTLDEFVSQITALPGDQPVRLTVVSMSGFRSLVSVEPEQNFWPTVLFEKGEDGWQRTSLTIDNAGSEN